MPFTPLISPSHTTITLANGQQWLLRSANPEADEVISQMEAAMNLSKGKSGKDFFVTVSQRKSIPTSPSLNLALALPICILPAGTNDAMRTIQMMKLAQAIAMQAIPSGGLLLHGALVGRGGRGVILAATGGTGKTTACSRIPPPWRALSDDATLVVRDDTGQYYAHPWPTWSRFFDNGPGGSWDVESAVQLDAIFILHQSPDDSVEPLNESEATAYLLESARQVMKRPPPGACSTKDAEAICTMELLAAGALVRAVPVNLLHISLNGRFWEEITRALDIDTHATRLQTGMQERGELVTTHDNQVRTFFGSGHIPVVYTGPSMNPTLREPDLLEVVPYENLRPKAGDVVCFYSSKKGKSVVHRITGISGEGIRTQGDNCVSPDPGFIQEIDILGRVVRAWHGMRNRTIAGGSRGRITFAVARLRKTAMAVTGMLLRMARPLVVCTRTLWNFFPLRLKPRVVLFSADQLRILRLYLGNYVAGEYHSRRKTWSIRFPFRLIVDEHTLPTIDEPDR